MAWELLKTDTLSGTSDTITLSSLDAKESLFVEGTILNSGSLNDIALEFNSDSGNNYCRRYHAGDTKSSDTNQPYIEIEQGSAFSHPFYFYANISNVQDENKICHSMFIDSNGTSTSSAPRFAEVFGVWNNSSDSINQIELQNNGSGDFAANSIFSCWGTN